MSLQAESNSELLFHIKRSTDIVILDGTCIPTSKYQHVMQEILALAPFKWIIVHKVNYL